MEKRIRQITFFIIIFPGFLLPLVMILSLSFMPSITPEEAEDLVREGDALLLDLRQELEFDKQNISGAVNFPLDRFDPDETRLKALLAGKKHILVICRSGISGALATFHLRRMGLSNALNIEGGLDSWLTRKNRPVDETDGGVIATSFTLFEQTAIVVAGFILKFLYQIISLVIIILLWKYKARDINALRWGLFFFLIGENACALNYLFFQERSLLMEFIHMYGMALCFGLVCYALLEAFDHRVFNYSHRQKKCVLLPLCQGCYKYSPRRCTLRYIFLFVIPATAIIAAMPFTAQIASRFYMGKIFGNIVFFGHRVIYQALEARFFPAIALVFMVLAFLTLFFFKENGFEGAKIFYSAGLGPLGFSLMRLFLYWGFKENPLWADFWEEITEFLFIGLILWMTLKIRASSKELKM